jgi:hypothetical protein
MAALLVAAHALAGIAAGLAALPWTAVAGMAAALIASLVLSLRRAGWLGGSMPVRALRVDAQGAVSIYDGVDWQEAEVLSTSRVNPHFILPHLRLEDGRVLRPPIFPDSLGRDDYRRLSAGLRWRRGVAGELRA